MKFALKGTAIANVTCLQLHRKAEKIAILLEKSGLTAGQHAALIYPPGIVATNNPLNSFDERYVIASANT